MSSDKGPRLKTRHPMAKEQTYAWPPTLRTLSGYETLFTLERQSPAQRAHVCKLLTPCSLTLTPTDQQPPTSPPPGGAFCSCEFGYFPLFRCVSAVAEGHGGVTQHHVFKVQPCCPKWQDFLPLMAECYSTVCIYHASLNPLTRPRMFSWSPRLGSCEPRRCGRGVGTSPRVPDFDDFG